MNESKEVICKLGFNQSASELMRSKFGIEPPQEREIYHVNEVDILPTGKYYSLVEFPPQLLNGIPHEHFFPVDMFEDVPDNMGLFLVSSLLADKPKELFLTAEEEWAYTGKLTRSYIEALDYNHNPDLTVMQTRIMINNCRWVMLNTQDEFKKALALVQLDVLMKHLTKLQNKFNKD